jgi:CPA1 family monovalent cation:H+ antiporter
MEHVIIASLLLMLAIVASAWIVRALPLAIPLPLIQIGLGVLIALFTTESLTLDPQVFPAVPAASPLP